MTKLARMQHMALEVSDTDRSIEFYREVLGFKLTERHAAFEVEAIPVELTFMRLGDKHHELVLVHNPKRPIAQSPPVPKMIWMEFRHSIILPLSATTERTGK